MTIGQEPHPLIEIDVGHKINAVTFTANGRYLVSGGREGVRVWGVQDGKQVVTMDVGEVRCLAVSKDGRWIAAGTYWGDVLVWDTKTFEQVFEHREESYAITGVDFAPECSTRLVASWWDTATMWDVATRHRVRTFDNKSLLRAARYSPQGDRIATATEISVQVWDSNDGRLLVDIQVPVTPMFNNGLLWFNSHLFVISDNKLKEIDAYTGSEVSEWLVSDTNAVSCIVMPQHGEFLAYSGSDSVLFWSTTTHVQLCLLPRYKGTRSIALSLDDRTIAFVAQERKVTVKPLSHITVSFVFRSIVAYLK